MHVEVCCGIPEIGEALLSRCGRVGHPDPTTVRVIADIPAGFALQALQTTRTGRDLGGHHRCVVVTFNSNPAYLDVIESYDPHGLVAGTFSSDALAKALGEVAQGRRVVIRPGEPVAYGSLTPRERQILWRVAAGMPYEEVAQALGVSIKTVRAAVSAIYAKTGLRNRSEVTLAFYGLLGQPSPHANGSGSASLVPMARSSPSGSVP